MNHEKQSSFFFFFSSKYLFFYNWFRERPASCFCFLVIVSFFFPLSVLTLSCTELALFLLLFFCSFISLLLLTVLSLFFFSSSAFVSVAIGVLFHTNLKRFRSKYDIHSFFFPLLIEKKKEKKLVARFLLLFFLYRAFDSGEDFGFQYRALPFFFESSNKRGTHTLNKKENAVPYDEGG